MQLVNFRKARVAFWPLLGLSSAIPALLICLILPGRVERGVSSVSPFLKLGPQAISTSAAHATYTLFTCQLVGLNSTQACYGSLPNASCLQYQFAPRSRI